MSAPLASAGAAVPLYPYQRRWLEDRARFKIGMFARQTGKTFTTTGEIVDDVYAHELQKKRTRWVILSRGERQAREAMEEGVKRWAKGYQTAARGLAEPRFYEQELRLGETRYLALEVEFPHGSRITALPANPDTARGFSANVFLDEFAFHKASGEIWSALFPVVSAGWKLRVTSTPNGKSNKFYQLMTGGDELWSRHKVDIYQAVADGLPRDIEELRRALADADAWAQEYELNWLDEASAWLSYDLIASCEEPLAGDPSQGGSGERFLGMDIGRRRDLTVIWVVERLGDVLWTRERVPLRRASFAAQEAELARLMRRWRPRRVCIDQTGLGEMFVERAQAAYGAYAVEGVLFTGPVKQDLAIGLKRSFEDRRIRVPVDQAVRDSLHSVRKITTAAGNERFDAERSETTGHADDFWAAALAVHAAADAGGPAAGVSIDPPSSPFTPTGVDRLGRLRPDHRLWSRPS